MRWWHPIVILLAAWVITWLWLRWYWAHARIAHFAAKPSAQAPLHQAVVLVHGFWGFDRLGPRRAAVHYFRNVATHLADLGYSVFTVRLPVGHSVNFRANRLATMLQEAVDGRVIIIGHSLGGLDARYAAAKTSIGNRLDAVVTVGTPHRGTPLADLFVAGRLRWLYRIARFLRLPVTALPWLSSEGTARFNREIVDVPSIYYASVIGGKRNSDSPMSFILRAPHYYMRNAGPNDGVVPLESQRWGDVLFDLEVDHLAQVGWGKAPAGFVAHELYEKVLHRVSEALAQRGSRS